METLVQLKIITDKYRVLYLKDFCNGSETLRETATMFSKDLIEVVDFLSRVINLETHPNYYSLNDATIVGLQVKIIKLHLEAIKYHEENKQEILAVLFRPLYESMVIQKYLIKNGEISQKSYRLSSYKARYENYRKLKEFKDQKVPLIKRQIEKIESKLSVDGFTLDDLEAEQMSKRKWKIDGKTFREINKEVDDDFYYSFSYGVGSDSLHGSWQESIDYHLTKKGDGYFGYYYYEKCAASFITSYNRVLLESIFAFLTWNKCMSENLNEALTSLLNFNSSILLAQEMKYQTENS